jgi:DNA modification methylase
MDAASKFAYRTKHGTLYQGNVEELLGAPTFKRLAGKVQLIFTSPPFPLNRKKRYGNLEGEAYVKWLAGLAPALRKLLTPNGSIVMEMGNAWERGQPVMSTLALEALLGFKRQGEMHLCQEFIAYNPARLPTPAQWVNVERCRVKDAYTKIWWMSPVARPRADNRAVLREYSDSMLSLLQRGTYNSGTRPSQHKIGATSFLHNNGGSIPPNVLTVSNTRSGDDYQKYCKSLGIRPHPARMQPEIVTFFVKFLTSQNDLVFDPFAGSNTTGAVAETLGRNWIASEMRTDYIAGSLGRFPGVRQVNFERRKTNDRRIG